MVMRISSLLPSAPTGMNKEKRLEMKRLMFMTGALSLALLACSGDDVSGTSNSPESSATENESSSSLLVEESSSSLEASSSSMQESSSSAFHALCKAIGGRGCAVSSFGDLWSWGNRHVLTNAYAEDSSEFGEQFGELFFEMGADENENSFVQWNDGRFVSEFGNGHLSANVWLNKGSMNTNPFFNVGFNVAGYDSNKKALSADISNWNGICVVVEYGSEEKIEPSIQLDLGDSINKKLGHTLPAVILELSDSTQCFEWNDFKISNSENGTFIISGEDAARHVEKIIFHFQSMTENNILVFEFFAIGTNRDD